MRISLGNSIIERVRSYIVEEGGSSNDDCYIKQLGRGKYRVCNLGDKRLQKELLQEIYYILEKYLPVHFIVRLNENNIQIINKNSRNDIWYPLGLAVADASIIGKTSVLFSTTQPCLIDASFNYFPRFSLSVPRYFVSLRTGKVSPVFNVVVYWPELASLLWKVRIERDTSIIFNNIDTKYMERFLAGVIDGDGLPDRDNLRIATSREDVLYEIIDGLFNGAISFDNKRFIIRIKTGKLREVVNLESLSRYILCKRKRRNIEILARKRKRYEVELDIHKIKENMTNDLLNMLREYNLLSHFKIRHHRGYRYLYITYNNRNKDMIFSELQSFTSFVKDAFGIDISDGFKRGKREIVVYNQKVVDFIMYLRELIGTRSIERRQL